MGIEARCAFVNAQAACVVAMTAAMQAQNALLASQGLPPVYAETDFTAMLDSHHVGHNAVIEYLREC